MRNFNPNHGVTLFGFILYYLTVTMSRPGAHCTIIIVFPRSLLIQPQVFGIDWRRLNQLSRLYE